MVLCSEFTAFSSPLQKKVKAAALRSNYVLRKTPEDIITPMLEVRGQRGAERAETGWLMVLDCPPVLQTSNLPALILD